MKLDIRWQLLLAVSGFGLVMALLTFQVQTAGLCSVRVPASGGVFSEGFVGSPQYLNPLLADDNPVDRDITSLIFDGLSRYETGELLPALAQGWEVSDDGLTVRFTLRDDVFWHDGEPLTAADVAFTYGLMQDDDFPGNSALKRLWQTVTIRQIDDYIIEFDLQEPYAGFLDATTRGILPAHLLQGTTAESLPELSFNRQPVGTGPFMVEPGQDWQQDRLLTLTPNPGAWREGSRIANLVFRFYPTEKAVLNAFKLGEIQAINSVSPALLPDVAQLPQARLFSALAPRYSALLFNLTEGGSPATQSAEVRRALAYGLDRETLVDETLNGQGVLHAGPYLPESWAYNPATLTLFSSQPISATTGLEGAGWTQAEGESIRRNGESALVLRFLVHDTPTNRELADKIAEEWSELGAAPQLTLFSDWKRYRQTLRERNFDVALVDVSPSGDPDLYDFWSQEAIIRGQNYAGWNRRRASEALEDGRRFWEVNERRPFYDAFLRYYDEDLPELSLFQHVYTYAVNEAVKGVEIGLIDHPRDRYLTMADWILLYREVTVSCAGDQL